MTKKLVFLEMPCSVLIYTTIGKANLQMSVFLDVAPQMFTTVAV